MKKKKVVIPHITIDIDAEDFAGIPASHQQSCRAWLVQMTLRLAQMGQFMHGPFKARFTYDAGKAVKIATKRKTLKKGATNASKTK